ncbi:hypothetical protein HMPREF1544_10565 [Mucor circinelloides 1006PhL]|uniref:Uncharacterized protein n=1 Tax=Mucor circinelloides f. circinelloides (strain 1006PhL) TaxID=1220926 RepID=S2IZI9_MUCC1|nr:hypothetical protein HMPREF1544_10565 [Mucor circinelloides 1006PhL]
MSSLEQQLSAMQQQIAALQAQLVEVVNTSSPMQSADDDTAPPPLHSFGTRPHYDWTPSDTLRELMGLDIPLHNSNPVFDSERKAIIEAYPPMAHHFLDYKAPATIPTAEQFMNRGQKLEDSSLKQLQYLLSAAFCPLDILIHEMFTYENSNPNLERYSAIMRDTRRLLLHVCAIMMTQHRNNIALRAVDPSFSMKPALETNYTLPLDEFQQTLIQQTAARKATREATTINRRQRRHFPSGTSATSNTVARSSDQTFFRPGPPSQQDGFSTNYNSNNYNRNNNNNIRPSMRLSQQQGYKIQSHTPPTTTNPTAIHPLSRDQIPLIDQTIQELLDKQAIGRVPPEEVHRVPGFYSSMFVIPKKDGGFRQVFNIKELN